LIVKPPHYGNATDDGTPASQNGRQPSKNRCNLKKIRAGQEHLKEEMLTKMDAKIDSSQQKMEARREANNETFESFEVFSPSGWISTKPGQYSLKKI
jgi:hypothetical protein